MRYLPVKIIIKLLLLLFCFNIFTIKAQAIAKFNTSYQVYYKVNEQGLTRVTFVISQKNNLSVVYATEFGISLNETKISNLVVKDEGHLVNPSIVKNQNQTIISFPFSQKVVGKDKVHNFTIEYDTADLAEKLGNTWQINIPRFETDENITDQTAILNLPSNFPTAAYIDPKPDIVNNNNYYFSSKILANKPISAIFGKNQYYKGRAKYYLENNTSSTIDKTITLFPDTVYQETYYENIKPVPKKITIDQDGNLLATYTLKPNQNLDIETQLFIKTYFQPRKNEETLPNLYTSSTKIWDYENNIFTIPELENLNSPKTIYDYVSNKLKYDYQKININGTIRTPASESLKNYLSAICTDYTDLFVSLARKAKIPARELEGLAMSENPDLKPTALEKDILHAWPEYYSYEKKQWLQVDPTWGSTTRGLDYFNKLDFNHIVFAIHGTDSFLPLPAGSFKKPNSSVKDLDFQATEEINFPKNNFEIKFLNSSVKNTKILIKNLNGIYLAKTLTAPESNLTTSYSEKLDIAPWGEKEITLNNKVTGLLTNQDTKVIITVDGVNYPIEISKGNTFKKNALFAGGCLVLGIIALVSRGLLLRRQK